MSFRIRSISKKYKKKIKQQNKPFWCCPGLKSSGYSLLGLKGEFPR